MTNEYKSDQGKVFVCGEKTFILEKYFYYLDDLYKDEMMLCEEIFDMDFSIKRRKIHSMKNENYTRVRDWKGIHEPYGPKFIWVLKFDLQYLGE